MKVEPYYAVAQGRRPGIYRSWGEAKEQVDGLAGARHKKFTTLEQAQAFIRQNTPGGPKMGSLISKGTVEALHKVSAASKMITKQPRAGRMVPMGRAPTAEANVPVGAEHGPIVYTDGACSSNGQRRATAGYGVYWGEEHPHNVSAPLEGSIQTNNRAEYTAVICALKQGIEQGHKKITIRTDSQLLISTVTSWMAGWKRNRWKKSDGHPPLNLDLVKELDEIISSKKIRARFEHVPGHSGIHGNEQADSLAVQGAQRGRVRMGDMGGSSQESSI